MCTSTNNRIWIFPHKKPGGGAAPFFIVISFALQNQSVARMSHQFPDDPQGIPSHDVLHE